MQDPNTPNNNMPAKPIIKHTLHTLIVLFLLSLLISATRAGFMIHELQCAAANEPFNLRLVQKWISPYPALYNTFMYLQRNEGSFIPRQPAQERVLLAIPNHMVNIVLEYTSPLWFPEGLSETAKAQIEKRHPHPQQAATAPRQRRAATAPVPADETGHTPTAQPPQEQEPMRTATAEATPSDPNAMWAAVITPSAPIYNANGQLQENIPPGSVVEILERRSTSNGTVFIGNIHTPIGHFPSVIVREQDLHLYRGKTLTATTLEEREIASRKAEIQGYITLRKQEIETEHRNRNPHQRQYHEALRRYQSLRQEARGLQTTYERTSGNERITAGNRLREIRQEMAAMTPSIRNLQQQRDSWAAANPLGPPPDPDQDARIISLRQQLSRLESETMTPR